MRRLLIPLALLLALVACAPALSPTLKRTGEDVVITLKPTQTLYSVTLSVLNATTDDERCATINVTDVGCVLGMLDADTTTTVVVTGEVGGVYCTAFGFTDEDLSVTTYRPWPCKEAP